MVKGLQRVPLFGIVMVALACDNVEWGGIDVGLRAPAESTILETSTGTVDATMAAVDDAPLVPALYMGRRVGSEAWLIPIAALDANGLGPLPEQVEGARTFAERHFEAGSTFTLFAEGVRVGTLTAASYGSDTSYCGARPQVRGPIELTPSAAASTSFLAVPSDIATSVAHDAYAPTTQTRDLRIVSLNMMRGLLPTLGSPWPESTLDIRQDIQVFMGRGDLAPTVVATFVYGDSLRVGPAGTNAYSVFLMASHSDGNGYQTTYVDHRVWNRHGKGAARFFGRIDVDQDGTSEVVVEVLGESSAWIAALQKRDGVWTEAYRDPCGLPAPAVTGTP